MEIPVLECNDQAVEVDEVVVEERIRLVGFMTNAWWRSLSQTIIENGLDQNSTLIEDEVLQLLNTNNWWRTYESIYEVVSQRLKISIPRSVRDKQPGSDLVRKERLANFLSTKYGHDGAYVTEVA
jgi:hypothetical protein